MGFLKNLLDLAGKVVSTAQDLSAQRTAAAAAAPEHRADPAPERSDAEWCAYFRGIIEAEFPDCELRQDVPVTELVGDAADEFKLYESRPCQVYRAEWGQPFTFVLYRSGAPTGIVMLGSGHSHSASVKYLIARMYATKIGLPYVHFYTQMPNERAYVAGRLHRFLD